MWVAVSRGCGKKKKMGEDKRRLLPSKHYMLIALITAVALPAMLVYPVAAINVQVTPVAPPGLGDVVSKFIGWVYWLAILACVAGVIGGVVMIAFGRDQGKYILVGALIGLAVLATLNSILSAI